MSRPDVELHVEQLVLHGFDPHDRHAVAGGLESQLRQLLLTHGFPASLSAGGELASLDLGSIEVQPGSAPRGVGAQVARTLYEGLSQ